MSEMNEQQSVTSGAENSVEHPAESGASFNVTSPRV